MIIDVKYKDIIDIVSKKLQDICCNINNDRSYALIPEEFRPGFRRVIGFGEGTEHPRYLTISIVGNGIQVYTLSEVEIVLYNYFNEFLRKNKNIFNEENEVTPNGILSFFDSLMIFCNETIKFYSSPLVPNRSFVAFLPKEYSSKNSSSKSNIDRIKNMSTNKVVLSSILDQLINDTVDLHKSNRTTHIKYNYSTTVY